MANILRGNEVSSGSYTTQVFKATHNEAGNRLPHMKNSFISFSYGGKYIEDFGLISVIASDRLERNAYASFADLTSNYDTLDGQLYWGSHYEPNKLELTLATDEMTEKQLDDFKEWFCPGITRELILSEHPNRAIQARIETAPTLSVLPFEKQANIIIMNTSYSTSTTIYKGEIQLSFVMDEPFWYSKLNFMPYYVNKKTLEFLQNNSNDPNKVASVEDKDMLKIMLEDGIPYQDNVKSTMFLGNDTLAVVEESLTNFARINISRLGITVEGNQSININSENPGYLFYSGTAPSKPIITFTLIPKFNFSQTVNGGTFTSRYISVPKNTFGSATSKSYITIGTNKFEFTTPSLLTGINQALSIFHSSIPNKTSLIELLSLITLGVNEYYSRAWAIACINSLIKAQVDQGISNPEILSSHGKVFLLNNMLAFLVEGTNIVPNTTIETDNNDGSTLTSIKTASSNGNFNCNPITFIFNSKTGEAIGKFRIRVTTTGLINSSQFIDIEQSVGDMVRSKYLLIEGRNYADSYGRIDKGQCKSITTDEDLTNVLILFKNMYL